MRQYQRLDTCARRDFPGLFWRDMCVLQLMRKGLLPIVPRLVTHYGTLVAWGNS